MKTISLKKVSAVAVASLGFGLLSVVPANAANAAGLVNSISLARVTSAPTTGAAVAVNFLADTDNLADIADDNNTFLFSAYLSSYPAGGFKQVAWSSSDPTTDTELYVASAAASTDKAVNETTPAAGYLVSVVHGQTDANNDYTGNTALATSAIGAAQASFTPTVAGTYVMTVWNDADADGVVDVIETTQTISITVAAASGYSAALSTVYMTEDLTDADNTGLATATTNATAAPLAIRTLNQKAAQIIVTTRDTDNAVYTGQAITATMSGSGFVSAGASAAADPNATQADTADGTATTTRTASVSAAANTTGTVVIGLWGDGTAGTGTVTISVTDKVSGATTTLATKTVTWYSGTAATLEVTTLQSIATPGVANGCSDATTCTQATLALTPAYVIVAKDSGGRVIPGLTITGTPTDTATIAATSVAIVTGGDDKNGRGYYNASVTGGAAANVGKKSVITWSTTLADGVTKITTTSEASLGGTPATVTWTLDKATYTPGAPVVITVTAKDAAGNAVGDGTYANLFAGASTLGGAITGSTPAASVEIKGGVKTFTAFAPGTAGTYTVSNKFGTSMPAALQGGAISSSIVVSDPNAALLTQIDALNAKIVALNALIAKIMKKLGVK